MRLLFLTNMYPPHEIGGYEQICEEVAIGLRQRGHLVSILTSRYGVDSNEHDSIKDSVNRSLYLQADLDYYRPLDFFLKRIVEEKRNAKELRKTIDRFQPDICMVWGMWELSISLPYWAETWLPGRVVYYIASYWPVDLDPHRAYWQLPARHSGAEKVKSFARQLALAKLQQEKYPPLLRFEHAVCCSQYVKDKLVEAGKIPADSGVMHLGIDPKFFNYKKTLMMEAAPDIIRVLYFGRLIQDKGVHNAIEAIGFLKQDGLAEKVELTILGSGHPDYESRLRKLVADFDIADQVNFIKKIPRDEIPAWLGKFDIFLFTSIWPEPFGRTIIEAMAAGLVVIGSDVGGSREIFKQGYDDDLLFQAEDSRALAGLVARVIADPVKRQRLALKGQQLVRERFNLSSMVDELEAYLEKVFCQSKPMDYANLISI